MRSTSASVFPLLAALVLACASPVSAQDVGPSAEARLRALFNGLPPTEHVRLMTPEVLVENARFVSLEPETVELQQIGSERPISVDLTAIRGVSVRRRHALQGMLWGVGSGLLVGSVGGMMVGGFGCSDVAGCGDGERNGAIVGATVLGLLGGGLGFTLGHHDIYWKPIFP